VAHCDATITQRVQQRMQRQIRRLRQLAQQPVTLPFQRVWPLALTGQAAGLPVARVRCDHFTTLATLTRNDDTTARQG